MSKEHLTSPENDLCSSPHENYLGPHLRAMNLCYYRQYLENVKQRSNSNLSLIHIQILDYLCCHRNEMLFQKDVERFLRINRSSVSGAVVFLEEQGYILRQSVKGDARLKHLKLTEKGLLYQEQVASAIASLEACAAAGFTEEEKNLFFSMCDRVIKNLSSEQGEFK